MTEAVRHLTGKFMFPEGQTDNNQVNKQVTSDPERDVNKTKLAVVGSVSVEGGKACLGEHVEQGEGCTLGGRREGHPGRSPGTSGAGGRKSFELQESQGSEEWGE